ncbi:AraC family transcriptional regulator [Streptomyces sp. AP-93]|uniref:AraC family transcriptional regulator n=1 Tax=Streptomyces sp. AP-93 TaxID=2929048 RepID=UPI001FAF06DB|nr:AraC family transcriptional regulator [Streptomyces sp. AP-93]MCJ0871942.1 AraC family transcriptional regulator [Streptomyces sp. AP-93]
MVSHAHQGTTSSALARLSVSVARLVGTSPHEFAHLLGAAPQHLNDDLCRIPSATAIRIAELTTVQAPWTEMSVLLAQESGIGTLGVWDYLITSAPTPLEGIRDAAAHFAAVADPLTDGMRITEDGGRVTISHVNRADMAHEAACGIRGYALGLYRRRLGEAAGRRLVPLHVSLAAKAPFRHDGLIELYGTRNIDFEAPASSITFRTADLSTPTPHAQPGLSAVLRRHAEQTLTSAIPLHDWLDLFRTALASAHDDGAPTLSSVARRMTISARTLQRRLEEHGTTWSEEVETVRRDHIARLLHDTDLSVESIAARSGYADARALRRAVKRWYGSTPAALRRAGRGDAAQAGV